MAEKLAEIGQCLGDLNATLGLKFVAQTQLELDGLIKQFDQVIDQVKRNTPEQQQQGQIPDDLTLEGNLHQFAQNAFQNGSNSMNEICKRHKKAHAKVSKCGKMLQKTFDVKIDKLKNMDVLQSGNDKKILNKLIFGHLCTEGIIDSALEFAKEAGVDVPPNIDSIYTKMQQLNTEIMECNVENAIEWVHDNSTVLESKQYKLEAMLLCMKFVQVILDNPNDLHSKFNILRKLSMIPTIHPDELKQLAGVMILDDEQAAEKLSSLNISIIKDKSQICEHFRQVYLEVHDLPSAKPLETCFKAGLFGLPYFLEQIRGFGDHLSLDTNSNDLQSFSFDFNMPNSCCFHSRFICPVLKVQSNESNMPQALSCGHVLTKEAITRISNSTTGYDFKCPYCPAYTKISEVQTIHMV